MMPLEVMFHVSAAAFFACSLLFIWLRIEVFRLSNVDAIEAVVAQLGRAKDEIVAKIATLQVAAAAGQDLTAPLADLAAAAQALDDVVVPAPADVVVPTPVVPAPADVPVEPTPPVQ
jgi:hypothetical protein